MLLLQLSVLALLGFSQAVPNPNVRLTTEICCPDIGCFSIGWGSDFSHMLELPWCPADMGALFYLYTPDVADEQMIDYFNLNDSVKQLHIDATKDLYVLIHGFGDDWPRPEFEMMKNALINKDHNVILVNWNKGSAPPNYFQASANTRVVGAMVALILQTFTEKRGQSMSNTHIVGHSLGAHTAGFAGDRLDGLRRIIGLDPASPLFEGEEAIVQLDPTDANFVQAIHTNGNGVFNGGWGTITPDAHVDFFANGGKVQPGCPPAVPQAVIDIYHLNFSQMGSDLACSHDRASYLFIDSIVNSDSNSCKYIAYPCDDEGEEGGTEWLSGQCFQCDEALGCPVVGYLTDIGTPFSGSYYFGSRPDNSSNSYCGFNYLVLLSSDTTIEGQINLTLHSPEFGFANTVMFQDIGQTLTYDEPQGAVLTAPYTMNTVDSVKVSFKLNSHWYWPFGADSWGLSEFNLVGQDQKSYVAKHTYTIEDNTPITVDFQ